MDRQAIRKRMFYSAMALGAAFGILIIRMAWLQLAFGHGAGAEASALAVRQRSDSLVLDSGRGQFYDLGGRKLTGETVWALAAFPEPNAPRGTEAAMDRLAAIVRADRKRLAAWLGGLRSADVWRGENGAKTAHSLTAAEAAEISRLQLTGIAALPYRNRYPAEGVASPLHAIGYVSQNPERLQRLYDDDLAARRMRMTDAIGGGGLEMSLDRWIKGIGRTEAMQVTDAARRPLEGLGLRVTAPDNPHYPLKVMTTIDADAQRAAEQAFARHGIKQGAIVVLDADNADVAAMVSAPALDPDHIGAPGTDARNRALIAVPPGSVFKTVTLAAALESGVTDWKERFRCEGSYGRYGLHCWRAAGHGVETLEQAYADSCNVVFAALAERMRPEALQRTAERLGLGRQVGWSSDSFLGGGPLRLLPEEEAGTVFKSVAQGRDGGMRTGTGIGQRDVRVSPLQAANMVVALLHDGQVLAPRIVREIRYADGGLLASLPSRTAPSAYGSIRPATAARLRQAMRAVVAEGTAERALAGAKWQLAGKSGTAELGDKPPRRNNHWFVGYGPAEGRARYAVAVLIENQPAGSRNRAAEVFGEVMESLRRLEAAKAVLRN